MTVLLGILLALVVLGVVYVMLPSAIETSRALSGPRLVTCPEDGGLTQIEFDARIRAVASLLGPTQLRVGECTSWPQRKGCDQRCIAGIELVDAKNHGLLIRPFLKNRARGAVLG